MSTTVDNRVVEMRFDNRNFESNVQTSLSTLEKLKQSLNLTGASKGLENIGNTAKNVDMGTLGNAVETVRMRFSALQVMGVAALGNIANSAVNTGKKMLSALTIDPIKTGFQEYETQMGAIQTILANTQHEGTNLKQVNGALNELNKYADQTIYNFTEMTRNIGTFTAAGVSLDTSVSSIKGIANLAAISGSTSQQASTAMYQLSQALAAGKVSLMDWNSVVNAGMGGKVFQDALKRTAEHAGTDVDALIKKYGSFRESLTQGEWLTTEVLTETLTQLSGAYTEADLIAQGYTEQQAKDIMKLAETAVSAATEVKTFTQLWDTLKESAQSGWAQTWQILVGDFEEAKALLTNISEVVGGFIGKTAEARNDLLQGWKDMGGRAELIEGLTNVFKGLISVIKPIGEAFREVFPSMTAKQLYDATVRFKELTSHLILSKDSAENLKKTFKGVFSVFEIVFDAVKAVAKGLVDLLESFTGVEGGILAVTGAIGDWISKFAESVTATNIFEKVVDGIVKVLSTVIKKLVDFSVKIGEAFADVGNAIGNVFNGVDFEKGFSLLNSGLFAGILLAIRNFIKGLSDPFDGVNGILENVTGILDDVRGCFQAYQTQLKAGTLLKIASAIGILAAAILVISTIDPGALAKSLAALTVLFVELYFALGLFTKISTSMLGVVKASALMITLGVAITILAGALKIIATIDTADIVKGLITIAVLMTSLSVFLRTANFGKIVGPAVGITILSTALLMLSAAVKSFGSMKWNEIGKGLTAMAGALAAIALTMNFMPKNMILTGAGLVIVASALRIVASALSDFGGMKWGEIGRGLAAMGGSLAILAAGLYLMNGTLAGSAALLIAAGALSIIAPILLAFADMSWKEIGKGLVTLAGAFAVIGVAGLLLGPLVPTLLGLSAAIALFGVAVLGIGAGITLIGVGLAAVATGFTALAAAGTAGATAIVAALSIIVMGIADLIPKLIGKLGEVITALCDLLVDCAPQIVESLYALLTQALAALATYTPMIVDYLMTFLIGLLDALATRMPELIQSAVNLISSFFQGVVSALGSMDFTTIVQGLAGVGLLAALMLALSAVASLIPGAMLGVLGMGVVIAELALVLAAVGALAQIPGLEWLISEGGNLLQTLGTAIGQFIGGIAGGIASGFTSSMPQMASDLSTFMTNLQPFINGAQSIDPSSLEGVKTLAQVILALTAADLINGVTSWITGGNSLSKFAEQLVPFGTAMKAYSDSVTGINASAVQGSATAAKALSEVANNLPNQGGLAALFAGDNTLADFATQLVPFGKGMKSYSDAVIGINAEAINASASAAKGLAKVAESIPNTGGIGSWFSGDNDIGDFGKKLVPFGESMKSYSDAVVGINVGAITNSVTAAKKLVELINSTSGIDTSGVNSFKTAVGTLATTNITGIANAFSGAASQLSSVGSNLVTSIANGMKSSQGSLTSVASSIVSSLSSAFKGQTSKMSTTGKQLITGLSNGIKSAQSKVKSAATTAAKQGASGAKSQYSGYYSAGKYLVQGFANGISGSSYLATAKARAVAKATKDAINNALGIKSPARELIPSGMYTVMGLAEGMVNNLSFIKDAGLTVGDYTKTTISKAVSKVADLMDGSLDSQPTIRPVVDLSNVEAGAGLIGDMLGLNPSVGVLANVGSINSMMNRRSQNGVNDDVVSAIDKLRKDLGNVGGDTYSIDGITYDDGSNIADAIQAITRAAKMGRRV